MSHFSQIETENIQQNIMRVMGALQDKIESLNRIDWANWDDTYNFIQNSNEAYIEANLYPESLAKINVNVILFIDTSGKIVYGKAIDLQSLEEKPIPKNLTDYLSMTDVLWCHSDVNSTVSGIVLLDKTPLLISSKPILTSQGLGPIRGTLVVGRYLDSEELDSLSKITKLPIEISIIDSNMTRDFQLALSALSSKTPTFVKPINSSYIAGYSLITDVEGSQILIIRASSFRDVYLQGQESVVFLALWLLLIGIVFSVLIWILLEKLVISPLTLLDKQVKIISEKPLDSNQLKIKGNDEFSTLSQSVNKMVSSLEQAQNLAGIGQLTTMVAHDLRNPLQSINTATYGLKRKLSPSSDKDIIVLLNVIQESVKYSDKIVSDLLDYSRDLKLELCVSDISQLVKESLENVGIPGNVKVVDEIAKDSMVKVDAYKMKRVFINIIRNAFEAMPKGGTLSLSSLNEKGNLEVVFADNGVGIPPDVLETMGKPLVTTKAKGMGLGFAICKRLVEAHKGSIYLESEVGKGTIIKVKLPFK